MIINYAKCTHEIISRIAETKATINKKTTLFNRKLTRLQLYDETTKCYICSIVLYGAGTRKLRNVHQIYLGSCAMWCRRRVETTWTVHMRNEVLGKVKQGRNIQHKIKIR
jgi:hypothetical protein